MVGDGTYGHPSGAPYDRLIATCSIAAIPPAWLAQVRPTGLILTSLYRDLGGGPLVRLQVDAPGQARGRFVPGYAGFMPVRSHDRADAADRLSAALAEKPRGETHRAATVGADLIDSIDFGMLVALRLPGVASIGFAPQSGPQSGPQRWLLASTGDWACLDEATNLVTQHGARRLWDEVESVHQQWVERGTPARDRLGLTVTDSGEHRFWLDTPAAVWWIDPPH